MSRTDWDNDGLPNGVDPTPGVDPNIGNPGYRMNPVNIPGTQGVLLDESTGWFAASPVNDPESFKILMTNMAKYGHIEEGDFEAAKKAWAEFTKNAGSLGSVAQNVEEWIALSPPMGLSSSGDGTSRSKSSITTQFTPSSAGADYTTASKAELGREASKKEMKSYTSAVNQRAKAEPTVSDITTTKTGDVSSSKGMQGTGFDPSLFARDFARSQSDYAENYAASSFLDLIEQSLTDPNRIGQVIQNG